MSTDLRPIFRASLKANATRLPLSPLASLQKRYTSCNCSWFNVFTNCSCCRDWTGTASGNVYLTIFLSARYNRNCLILQLISALYDAPPGLQSRLKSWISSVVSSENELIALVSRYLIRYSNLYCSCFIELSPRPSFLRCWKNLRQVSSAQEGNLILHLRAQ